MTEREGKDGSDGRRRQGWNSKVKKDLVRKEGGSGYDVNRIREAWKRKSEG